MNEAVERGRDALLGWQSPEGWWCAELRADTTLESDAIMLWAWLGGREEKLRRLAAAVLARQNEDGGWPIYRNGPSEVSATVKAYWALKLAGLGAEDPRLERARRAVERLGGVHKVNTYTKFYLALWGLYDWRGVPAIPPELVLLPKWSYVNLYAMSAWTRVIVVPLSVLWALKPRKECPPRARLDELFTDGRAWAPLSESPGNRGLVAGLFLLADRLLKALDGRFPALRARALRAAEAWLLERTKGSDGPGAIFPAIVNSILMMDALGWGPDDPRLAGQLRELEKLELDRGDRLELQPCLSPVWDTALVLHALLESGLEPSHPALLKAAEWLEAKEIRRDGDWKAANPRGRPSGWAFEFNNDWYPDVDDTAMALCSLRRLAPPDPQAALRLERVVKRATAWLLSMQSTNGGWAAFDRDNDRGLLTRIPFADHNAMIDPPTADVTGRVLELLGRLRYPSAHPQVRRAARFLLREQEADGSWFGRWGVHHVYGTFLALGGLARAGFEGEPAVRRGAEWLLRHQGADGGWGETCAAYDDPTRRGAGPSTPSQTAWAVMGLISAGLAGHPAVERGVRWLVERQGADGTWAEDETTGTGFPGVFYLEYTRYRDYFPVTALGQYRQAVEGGPREGRDAQSGGTGSPPPVPALPREGGE